MTEQIPEIVQKVITSLDNLNYGPEGTAEFLAGHFTNEIKYWFVSGWGKKCAPNVIEEILVDFSYTCIDHICAE